MNSPQMKAWVSQKRKRNFLAKKLREDRQFKPKREEDKRGKYLEEIREMEALDVYGNQDDCY